MRFLNSVKSLYAAVGILILSVGLGWYVDVRNEAMHAQHLAINTGLERMIRLNQTLTNMLELAVLKEDALAAASYDTVASDLEQTMKTVGELAADEDLGQEISALSSADLKLRTVETEVVRLMAKDKWKEAAGVLFGENYVLERKTLEIDSEAAVVAVTGRLAANADHFAKIRAAALASRIGALMLLIWVGLMFSRRTAADLAEQKQLRDEIKFAYEGMEQRVRERTAELEASTRRLVEENQERERAAEALLQSEARLRTLFDSNSDALILLDENGFFDCNPAALAMFGCATREAFQTKSPGDLSPPSQADGRDSATMANSHIKMAMELGSHTFEWNHKRVDSGEVFPAEVLLSRMELGGRVVFQATVRDVTEKRRAQEEQKQRMQELESLNRLTMGREDRMIQLKQEINALLEGRGTEKKYKILEDE